MVKKPFAASGVLLRPGDCLTGDQIRSFRNFRELVTGRYIDVATSPESVDDRFLVNRGFGRFAVLKGRVIASGITKAEALTLVGG